MNFNIEVFNEDKYIELLIKEREYILWRLSNENLNPKRKLAKIMQRRQVNEILNELNQFKQVKENYTDERKYKKSEHLFNKIKFYLDHTKGNQRNYTITL